VARHLASVSRMDDLEAAWAELHEVNASLGWYVGMPAFYERRDEWQLYAFDPTERPKIGHRSREFTAVAPTQERVVRDIARWLREISAGRVPR
jgi:hypothetical protein